MSSKGAGAGAGAANAEAPAEEGDIADEDDGEPECAVLLEHSALPDGLEHNTADKLVCQICREWQRRGDGRRCHVKPRAREAKEPPDDIQKCDT